MGYSSGSLWVETPRRPVFGCFWLLFKLFGLLPSNGLDALKLLCIISKSEHISSFLEASPKLISTAISLVGFRSMVKPCLKKHQRTWPATLGAAVQDGIVRQTRCADDPGVLRMDKLNEFWQCIFVSVQIEVEQSTIVVGCDVWSKSQSGKTANTFLDQFITEFIYIGWL